jgi:hypothetical protein
MSIETTSEFRILAYYNKSLDPAKHKCIKLERHPHLPD